MNTPAPAHSHFPQSDTNLLRYEDDGLYFDSRPLEVIAAEVGTPFFLISERALEANYRAIERGLSGHVAGALIRYCAKTNNEAGLLRVLAGLGSDVLTSHLAEAQLALACGFPPDRIAFQQPVLNEADIRQMLTAGITFFHVFQEADLDLLDRLASEQGAAIRISLRLRNGSALSTLNPLGFYAQRLGFSAEEILPAVDRLQQSDWLSLVAINFYCGTQLENPKRYSRLLHRSARLVSEIHARYGLTLEEVNIGGGLPSPSMLKLGLGALRTRLNRPIAHPDPPTDLEAYTRSLLARFMKEFENLTSTAMPRLVVEPGRSIVGNATLLLTRVQAVRRRWAFLDASKNYLPENTYLFTRQILPCRRTDLSNGLYHLSGSTLNTLDVIDVGRRLPHLESGDLLALCDAGAYSISRSTRYAGSTPSVYLLRRDGELESIRCAGDAAELTALMTSVDRTALADR